jgi:hypothetical protein
MTSVTHTRAFEMAQPVAELFPLSVPKAKNSPRLPTRNSSANGRLCLRTNFHLQLEKHAVAGDIDIISEPHSGTEILVWLPLESG